MKKLLVLATALMLATTVQAQTTRPAATSAKATMDQTQSAKKLTPQEVQERFANMTPEQKAKMNEQMKARYAQMSPEERAKEKERLEKAIAAAKARKDDATVTRFQERLNALSAAGNAPATTAKPATTVAKTPAKTTTKK